MQTRFFGLYKLETRKVFTIALSCLYNLRPRNSDKPDEVLGSRRQLRSVHSSPLYLPTTKQRRATQDADSSFPAKRSSRPSRSAILGEGKRDGWYRNKAQQKIVPQSTPYRITHQTIYLPVFYHLFNSAVKGCACDCPSGPKTKRTRRIRIHKRSQTAVGPAASTVFHSGEAQPEP